MDRRTFLHLTGMGTTLAVVPGGSMTLGQNTETERSERVGVLERATPESQGISSSALLAFVNEAEETLNALHSVMIARNGRVIAEGWWTPYSPELNHWLFSLSKGFTATGVGIAIAEGRLRLDDAVISFFSEEAPKAPSENLKAMTVRDLLKMTHGHHGSAKDVMRADTRDWARSWLAKVCGARTRHALGIR